MQICLTKSYNLKIEKKSSTEDSITLKSTVSVNADNIRKISSSYDPSQENVDNGQPSTPSTTNEDTTTKSSANSEKNTKTTSKAKAADSTISQSGLPNTGLKNVIILISIISGLTVLLGIKNNKYKDIK